MPAWNLSCCRLTFLVPLRRGFNQLCPCHAWCCQESPGTQATRLRTSAGCWGEKCWGYVVTAQVESGCVLTLHITLQALENCLQEQARLRAQVYLLETRVKQQQVKISQLLHEKQVQLLDKGEENSVIDLGGKRQYAGQNLFLFLFP